uniref:Spermatogenesis-associated protein 32 n=1 Tax=Catagonus wagneri TaxID=51154 RepID=A0A8C3YF75_9CETA
FLELEPPHKEVLNLDRKPGPERKPKSFEQPELRPVVITKPEVKLKAEPVLKTADLEPCDEDPKPQGRRLESLRPHPEGLRQQDGTPWTLKPNSSYVGFAAEKQVSPDQRSIRVQTSRHLFWSDKLIQASEDSLQDMLQKSPTGTSRYPEQQLASEDTSRSRKLLQDPSDQPAIPDAGSPRPPSPEPSSSAPTIGLAELINFASSLAVASSSKMDLPSLKHLIQAPPRKATEPPAEPGVDRAALPTADEPKQEKLTQDLPPEKPLEAKELPDAPKEQDRHLPHTYLDFSKPGFKRATIEGEVKLLQSPNTSPQPQGAVNDSVPGTKKGRPLLLKIHFKLSSPTSPEK